MKKLEDKILKKVYWFETKKIIREVTTKIMIIFLGGFLSFILFSLLIDSLMAQGSFDLLDIFSDDLEVVRRYFFDNILIFFEETPKLILLLTIVSVVFTFLLTLILIKNLKIIKNKVKSIINYWFK